MQELLIFRHAKSRWDEAGVADHDRDLAPRGRRAAQRMGQIIAEHDWIPDLVLCSTAMRAQRTLTLAVGEWPTLPDIRSLRSLYLAAPSRIIEIIERQRASIRRLMVVGHNPGLHTLALRLSQSGDHKRALQAKFPTAALARIGFDQTDWKNLTPGPLLDLIKPRDLDPS